MSSFRETPVMKRQIAVLLAQGFRSKSEVITMAIDRMYQQEVHDIAAIDAAMARVNTTPQLVPHKPTIFADWNEGDEHWRWIASAPVAEIVAWAEVVEGDKEQVQP